MYWNKLNEIEIYFRMKEKKERKREEKKDRSAKE